MDQITIDVTGLHAGDVHDWIGCRVELISRDSAAPTHLPRIAEEAGLIPHEMLTRLNPRILRTTSVRASVIETEQAGRAAHAAADAPRVSSAAG